MIVLRIDIDDKTAIFYNFCRMYFVFLFKIYNVQDCRITKCKTIRLVFLNKILSHQ